MTKKEAYITLCQTEATIPIFMQNWWLEAAITEGSHWDVVLIKNEKNEIEAALTYNIRKKYMLFTAISEPHLTPFCGIWFKNNDLNIELKNKMVVALLEQLPQSTKMSLRFHFSYFPNDLAIFKAYKTEIRQTFILNLNNADTLFNHFNKNLKREITKASQYYTCVESDDFDIFLKLQDLIYKRQNIKNPIPESVWKSLETVLKQKNRRKIYLAQNPEGEIEAAIYIVFDETTAYYLASGVTEGGRQYDGVSFLLWQAINECAKSLQVFDFEGSMMPNISFYFKKFGTERKEYLRVYFY